jgi:glycerophosphoryl diester phosphodiesterase
MSSSPTVFNIAHRAWQDFLHAWRELVVFQIVFKALEAWLLVPAVAWMLSVVLHRAGYVAVSNKDIADFLLTPLGLVYAFLFLLIGVFFVLLEQAGVMMITARARVGGPWRWPLVPRIAALTIVRVARLGAVQLAILLMCFLPLVVLALITYSLLLTQHDIYYYWTQRPPSFWMAVSIGVVLLIVAAIVALLAYTRWAFALPILLFEKPSNISTLQRSRERTHGVRKLIAGTTLGWLLAMFLLGLLVMGCFHLLASWILAHSENHPTIPILLLLVVNGGLLAGITFVTAIGLGLLTRRLYLAQNETLGITPESTVVDAAEALPTPSLWTRRLATLGLIVVLAAPITLWADLSNYLPERETVAITAHRGHAHIAPENTLSAIQKAIDSRADYAEIDVQRTADGAVVLLHDRDFQRVAGVPRRIDDMTLAEVQELDVGRWFSEDFADERAPTLAEAMALARGKIGLNIELKFYTSDRRLVDDVATLIQENDFASECLVTSLNYDACIAMKERLPSLRVGWIVAQALGDISRVKLEILSVRADFLNDTLLRSIHRHGHELHVWTVNDPAAMLEWMKRGADNIITGEPDLAIRVRQNWQDLTGPERLVLSARLLLGLQPGDVELDPLERDH